jgi:hypothetical protein
MIIEVRKRWVVKVAIIGEVTRIYGGSSCAVEEVCRMLLVLEFKGF